MKENGEARLQTSMKPSFLTQRSKRDNLEVSEDYQHNITYF